jgi:hypothetical protein
MLSSVGEASRCRRCRRLHRLPGLRRCRPQFALSVGRGIENIDRGLGRLGGSLLRVLPARCEMVTTLAAQMSDLLAPISEENKPVVLALAQALIDHPQRTLNAAKIDEVIAKTLACQALAAEQARRAAWRQVTGRVPEITS